jgi:hypothetical protein
MTKKVYNLNNTIPHSVCLVNSLNQMQEILCHDLPSMQNWEGELYQSYDHQDVVLKSHISQLTMKLAQVLAQP